ncbi:MAG: HU family DNA-binding protein [Alistipes sp.]
MNKSQFADAIALEAGLTRIEAKKAIDASIRVAMKAFREGENLTLSGLGSFSVIHKDARVGRNPRTGASVKIAAHRVLKFRSTLEMD